MNKFLLPIFLIGLALGIFFTYTTKQYQKVKDLRTVNKSYESAIADSVELIKKREQVVTAYNSISADDRNRLERILPDHVDNVRLIIDIRKLIARRGITIKNVKTSSTNIIVGNTIGAKVNKSAQVVSDQVAPKDVDGIESVSLSFSLSTTYETFIEILKDLESSLRILEVSKISFVPNDITGQYDFNIEVKTFWLKQQ